MQTKLSRIPSRGSALLTAVVVVTLVMVLAVGIVRYASRESAGATALRQEQALVACAAAGRQLLMARFGLFEDPTAIEALNVPLGTTGADGATRVIGGHYDQPTGTAAELDAVKVTQVVELPAESVADPGPTDLTAIIGGGVGRTPAYRVVVRCQDGTVGGGRQLEVEFGLRFGL